MVLVVTITGRGYNPIYTVYIQFCQTRLLWCWYAQVLQNTGVVSALIQAPHAQWRPAESLHKIPTSWAWERTCRKTGNSTGVEKESWGSSLELFLLKVIISIHWFSASQVFHMLQLPDDLWHCHFLTATHLAALQLFDSKKLCDSMFIEFRWNQKKGFTFQTFPTGKFSSFFLATLRHHRPSRLCWPAALVRSCAYFNKHLWY